MEINLKRPKVEVQRSKAEVVEDMCDLIRRMPLEASQIKSLYDSVTMRMVSKTCSACGRLGLEIEGHFTYPGGDLSKPKQFFICRSCK